MPLMRPAIRLIGLRSFYAIGVYLHHLYREWLLP